MHIAEFVQEYGPLSGILAGAASVLGLAFTVYRASHARHVRLLKEQNRQLTRERDQAQRLLKEVEGKDPAALEQLVTELRQRYSDAESQHLEDEKRWQAEREELKAGAANLRAECNRHHATEQGLSDELEAEREARARRDQAETTRANLLKKAMRLEGRLWERKVIGHVPRFRPYTNGTRQSSRC
jgi:hypothetical protein